MAKLELLVRKYLNIIILLILAGVAISLAVDSDGLFGKAEDARNQWNDRVAEEGSMLENLMLMANSLGGEEENFDVIVTNTEELREALESATDNYIIGIMGRVEFPYKMTSDNSENRIRLVGVDNLSTVATSSYNPE